MKLARIGAKVHLAGRGNKVSFDGGKTFDVIASLRCQPKRWMFEFGGHPIEFEGGADQVNCKRCVAHLRKYGMIK